MKSEGYAVPGVNCAAYNVRAQPSILQPSEFAFMRALLQGVDLQTSWRRYLGIDNRPGTAQEIKLAIDHIRHAFAVASMRHRRPGTARLVMMDFTNSDLGNAGHPPLADFVAEKKLDGFSEAEQFGLYEQHFGARTRRRARLVARQLDALNWLQQVAQDLPLPQDLIGNWLEPRLANRLATAGLIRTDDLLERMRQRGSRWRAGIDGIGAIKAGRIAAALPRQEQLATCGHGRLYKDTGCRPSSAQPNRSDVDPADGGRASSPSVPSIAPLRRQFGSLPSMEVGGPLRAPPTQCQIAARNDVEAVRCWLQAGVRQRNTRKAQPEPAPPLPSQVPFSAGSAAVALPGEPTVARLVMLPVPGWSLLDKLSNTQRAYWKEAERFLLWLMIERRTALSALTPQDCSAYIAFLKAPEARWCGQRARARDSALWRPFEGPLSPSAQAHALCVLRCLYRFLVSHRYLRSTPWEASDNQPARPVLPGPSRSTRRFDLHAWQIIEDVQRRLPPTSANLRLQVAIDLLRCSNARLGDLVRATVDDLKAPQQPHQAWQLQLRRADKSVRTVCLAPDALRLLEAYFGARGLAAPLHADTNRGARLLGRATDARERAPWAPCARAPFDPWAGIGLGTMADQLRGFFQLCAQACTDDAVLAANFRRANSHWLRGAVISKSANPVLRRQR